MIFQDFDYFLAVPTSGVKRTSDRTHRGPFSLVVEAFMPDKLLRVAEAATRLGLQPSTIRSWVLRRKVTVVRVGGRAIRIPSEEVDRIVKTGTIPAKRVVDDH